MCAVLECVCMCAVLECVCMCPVLSVCVQYWSVSVGGCRTLRVFPVSEAEAQLL